MERLNEWRKAWLRLKAFREHLPDQYEIHESLVHEYHELLKHFNGLLGQDLSEFSVSAKEIRPKVVGITMATRRRAGQTHYSDDSYCLRTMLLMKLDALIPFLESSEAHQSKPDESSQYRLAQPVNAPVIGRKVFISYSWDSEVHKKWALSFARLLLKDGIDAIIDQLHLDPGGRTPEFMERSVRESQYVLVICTPEYKLRFDCRKGGVGYEGHIITADVLGSEAKNKFIPVLRQGDWKNAMPTALDGIYGVDLRTDNVDKYRGLVRHLSGVPKDRVVGNQPDWLHDQKFENTVQAQAHRVNEQSSLITATQAYWDERKRLPDSVLMQKISGMPRWCIWSRPEEFRKARFQDVDNCAEFVASASVQSPYARWSQYPWLSTAPERGDGWIASEIETDDLTIKHLERWVLFRSGQFVHNKAFDQVLQLGDRTHVLEILDTATALFEFVGRMADRGVFTDRIAITFELKNVAGRRLTWPRDIFGISNHISGNAWCQEESILVEYLLEKSAVTTGRRQLALEVALKICACFGWIAPSSAELENAQKMRFG